MVGFVFRHLSHGVMGSIQVAYKQKNKFFTVCYFTGLKSVTSIEFQNWKICAWYIILKNHKQYLVIQSTSTKHCLLLLTSYLLEVSCL